MSTAAAYLILAAEIALGLILITAHEVRHHGLIPVLAASARRRPAPAPTPHAAWERARLSRGRSASGWLAAAAIDTGLGLCWITGHRVPVLISAGAAVLVIAAGQPLAVRASRRPAPPQAGAGFAGSPAAPPAEPVASGRPITSRSDHAEADRRGARHLAGDPGRARPRVPGRVLAGVRRGVRRARRHPGLGGQP